MSQKRIAVDFYFDYSCPWTYLGFRRLVDATTRTASDIHWKPINLEMVKNILDKPIEIIVLPDDLCAADIYMLFAFFFIQYLFFRFDFSYFSTKSCIKLHKYM